MITPGTCTRKIDAQPYAYTVTVHAGRLTERLLAFESAIKAI